MRRFPSVLLLVRFALAAVTALASSAELVEAKAAEAVVTDVRVGEHAAKTRFVVDLSRPVPVQLFTLADPYRVVLDMPEVGWRLPARPLPKRTGLFDSMRYGLFKPGQSRMVLEANAPVEIKAAFLLGPGEDRGYRFVLDLARSDRESFIAGLQDSRLVSGVTGGAPDEPAAVSTVSVSSAPASAGGMVEPAFMPAPHKPRFGTGEKLTVVVDPGHGGADPGTIGASGSYEKHITLAFARDMKDILEATGRYGVVLTRDRDRYVPLRQRVDIARKADADLFISLHADSIKNRKVRGASVYTLSETASDKEAAALAEKENKVDVIAGVDLSHESPEVTNILIDLAQRETMNESARFANLLIDDLQNATKMLRNTHRFAGFVVLKAPDVPSVLVELGFLSNPTDERNLQSRDHRRGMARAMVRAIDSYFQRIQQAKSN